MAPAFSALLCAYLGYCSPLHALSAIYLRSQQFSVHREPCDQSQRRRGDRRAALRRQNSRRSAKRREPAKLLHPPKKFWNGTFKSKEIRKYPYIFRFYSKFKLSFYWAFILFTSNGQCNKNTKRLWEAKLAAKSMLKWLLHPDQHKGNGSSMYS